MANAMRADIPLVAEPRFRDALGTSAVHMGRATIRICEP
jgi:hypothetical protein